MQWCMRAGFAVLEWFGVDVGLLAGYCLAVGGFFFVA